MEEIRLQKFFTDCGIMSRRAAEEEIRRGRVKVNGITAEVGQKILPNKDKVEYLGKEVKPKLNKKYKYVILNKPRGYLSTSSDIKDGGKNGHSRKCVTELVAGIGSRLYPVGRLDMDSDGLILMTDDGELANILTHPRHEIPKKYEVVVQGVPTHEQLEILRSPLLLDGYRIQPVKTEQLSTDGKMTVLRMTLFEGRNRQIRKMCELASLKVETLTRVAIGDITLDGLEVGKWRFLTEEQIKYLKKQKMGADNPTTV